MSFKAIKGTFHVVGYSPDGDSIRFKADDPSNWNGLRGGRVKLNSKGHAQLRIEAIDTLETHYKSEHQPPEFANAATNKLFELLGIDNVVWSQSGYKVVSANDGVPGFIVSRMAERYGRPVSFVFDGSQDFEDGQEIYLDNSIAKKSVNYQMLIEGMAYPTFYDGMFYDLRELFGTATKETRDTRKGIWSKDTTNQFFNVDKIEDISETHVILPKLFRRITAYIKDHGNFDPADFIAELEENPEKVLILSILHFTHLDNIIKVDAAGHIKLTQLPENLVFLG